MTSPSLIRLTPPAIYVNFGLSPAASARRFIIAAVKNWGQAMALVLRRTAIFLTIVMLWALLAAAVARAQQPQQANPPEPAKQTQPVQQAEQPRQPEPPKPAQPQQAKQSPSVVPFPGYRAGTIVVKTNDRRLYYVLKDDKALEFPVGVGKEGWRWFGRARVEAKYIKPAWQAPPELAHGHYGAVIPGGSPRNPMGVAALTLLRESVRQQKVNHQALRDLHGFFEASVS